MNCRVRFATSGLVVHIGATTPRTSSRVILSTGLSLQAGKACFSSVRRQMDRTALSPLGPRGFDGLFYSLPEGGHYRGPLARQGITASACNTAVVNRLVARFPQTH